MNQKTQKQLIDILRTIVKATDAVNKLIVNGRNSQIMEVLTQIQETAIQVGTEIEATEGAEHNAVKLLEALCEQIWQCTQAAGKYDQMHCISEMKTLLRSTMREVENIEIKNRYIVVFFPYKASMWDCMESVWMAAREDPECEVYVVPIPYYSLVNGKPVEEHYEINQFPSYVEVTDYRNFPLEKQRIDMAYIHNPFDQFNIVTTVHPAYYSQNLKKHVDKLTYIPYYVTGNSVDVHHKEFVSHYVVDYIVTQSEQMIESYASGIPREKFLPFGSPITDRILRLEKEKPSIPEEWKPMLPNGKDFEGKRTVFLNTSISSFMKGRERYLDKLEYVINIISREKNLFIIWRPHPLLHSTAETMGEKFNVRLKKIENDFLSNKIGVLDTTTDVGITVALSDAYLGENASSIIHMFGIARKPRFYFDFMLRKQKDSLEQLQIYGSLRADNKEYFTISKYGYLFEKNLDTEECRIIATIPEADCYQEAPFQKMCKIDNVLYLQPYCARGLLMVNLDTYEIRQAFPAHSISKGFNDMVCDGEKLYLRPERYEKYVCYCVAEKHFEYFEPEEMPRTIIDKFKSDIHTQTQEEKICITKEVVKKIQTSELLNANINHEWLEREECRIEEYIHYLQNAKGDDMKGPYGMYQTWLATLDGTCGVKVHKAVKESLGN